MEYNSKSNLSYAHQFNKTYTHNFNNRYSREQSAAYVNMLTCVSKTMWATLLSSYKTTDGKVWSRICDAKPSLGKDGNQQTRDSPACTASGFDSLVEDNQERLLLMSMTLCNRMPPCDPDLKNTSG